MQVAIFVIFLVLIALMGMRVWYVMKTDKTMSFFEAVDSVLSEDEKKENKNENEKV